MNPHQVTKDFETAVCEYTGAPYCVAVNSCTNALFLCLMLYKARGVRGPIAIPKRTYVSVPMQIKHAGYEVAFHDDDWTGAYTLSPTRIWDCARSFTSGMYVPLQYMCVSFHWRKILGIQQGGAILHDDAKADAWFRRARFDGRTEGVAPKDDEFLHLGWHCYMSPEVAAEGLVRLSFLPKHNEPLPNDDYPDLSKLPIFENG